jgi:hypothetical protein
LAGAQAQRSSLGTNSDLDSQFGRLTGSSRHVPRALQCPSGFPFHRGLSHQQSHRFLIAAAIVLIVLQVALIA